MKKFLELLFGIVAGLGFLWAGSWILIWDVGMLRKAESSANWPQAQGTVIRSETVKSGKEPRPHVEYTYSVAEKEFVGRQISFDLFDKPGGEGRVETILARYPVGRHVTVFVQPDRPEIAILEPRIFSPFLQPLMFSVIFFGGGGLICRKVVQLCLGRDETSVPRRDIDYAVAPTVVLSVLFYSMLVIVSFNSAVRETFGKAFGERPAGIPVLPFMLILQTILFAPMPWVFWHGMRIRLQALQDGMQPDLGYLLYVSRHRPELQSSRQIVIAGSLYSVVICLAWIAFAATRGV